MKLPLLLPLLLGAISARHLGYNAPPSESLDIQASIIQNSDCSGEHKGELALHGEEIPSGEEEAEDSGCHETLEDKDDLDSDPATSGDFEGPKGEDTVQLQGTSGHKTFHIVLVNTPETFAEATDKCKRWYKGNLVSIHDLSTNYHLRYLASGDKQSHIWIGATVTKSYQWTQYAWTDGSIWNFSLWAPGQPANGEGNCVSMCTQGGLWMRANCTIKLPFICSA
ncbi:proteoglycan 3-like [Sorex araneus]|uniref:proteoglycan 3-like n=1 Tax=Sorex araneus TaxID=42254 RepID=UPI0024337DA0|nr:proteoglycan 3-like [Sorex araneus]